MSPDLLGLAEKLALRLLNKRCYRDGHNYWNTLCRDETAKIAHTATENLYSGNAGVALFFCELAGLTGKDEFLNVADKSLLWISHYCHLEESTNLSGITGSTSIIYPFLRMAAVTSDNKYIEKVIELLRGPLSNGIPNHYSYDYLSGRAGILLAVLHLYQATHESWLLSFLECEAQYFVDKFRLWKRGVFWDFGSDRFIPLCGFSHGAAGIAFVLQQLSPLFGQLFEDMAMAACDYETWCLEKFGKWPDTRKGIYSAENLKEQLESYHNSKLSYFNTPNYTQVWCHGAAGIGLSRLGFFQKDHRQDIKTAHRILAEWSDLRMSPKVGSDLTYCHGVAGIAEFFLHDNLARYPRNDSLVSSWVSSVDQTLDKGLSFSSGYDEKYEDNSLFKGLAGIGHFLLRIYRPQQIPSILRPNCLVAKDLSSSKFIPHSFQTLCIQKVFPKTIEILSTLPQHKAQENFNSDGIQSFSTMVKKILSEQSAPESLSQMFEMESQIFEIETTVNPVLAQIEQIATRQFLANLDTSSENFWGKSFVLSSLAKLYQRHEMEEDCLDEEFSYLLLFHINGHILSNEISHFSFLILSFFQEPSFPRDVLGKIEEVTSSNVPREVLKESVHKQLLDCLSSGVLIVSPLVSAKCED